MWVRISQDSALGAKRLHWGLACPLHIFSPCKACNCPLGPRRQHHPGKESGEQHFTSMRNMCVRVYKEDLSLCWVLKYILGGMTGGEAWSRKLHKEKWTRADLQDHFGEIVKSVFSCSVFAKCPNAESHLHGSLQWILWGHHCQNVLLRVPDSASRGALGWDGVAAASLDYLPEFNFKTSNTVSLTPKLCDCLWAMLPLYLVFKDESLGLSSSPTTKSSAPVLWNKHSGTALNMHTLSHFHYATPWTNFYLISTSGEIGQGLCPLPFPKPFHKSSGVSPSSVSLWHLIWMTVLGLCINVRVFPTNRWMWIILFLFFSSNVTLPGPIPCTG